MSDRERLIKLLDEYVTSNKEETSTIALADYLISRGVTVREKGEWISEIAKKENWKGQLKEYYQPNSCAKCHVGIAAHTNYCPNCGALMDGGDT